ncbi:MAG TPA: hypothetical protein DCF93_03530 [Desulfuromonas sp.]|nr:hypothetical protein [Desulfuromonas sp.]
MPMDTYRFPEQKTAFSGKAFSSDNLCRVFAEIFRLPRPFTGFLEASTGSGTLYFLFFLQSEPYAAGKFNGKKPFNITITDFFAETFALPPAQLRLSLHETDPILLKSMLILLQDEPTAKAPVSLIDLEQISRQILVEAGDALIVLEKGGMFNFFFIKNGKSAKPHFADTAWVAPADHTPEEQMLLYAFDRSGSPVVAHIYRDIATAKSSDVNRVDRQRLLELARTPMPAAASPILPTAALRTVTVAIVAGAGAGQTFTAAVPCTVGRKDCDIVIADPLVSRNHARFTLEGGSVVIEDLGSTNGTLVNGVETRRATLTPDDLLTLGDTNLKIVA